MFIFYVNQIYAKFKTCDKFVLHVSNIYVVDSGNQNRTKMNKISMVAYYIRQCFYYICYCYYYYFNYYIMYL